METGIQLIAKEREEQLTKHNRTVEQDVEFNNRGQLIEAVNWLISLEIPESVSPPYGWNKEIWTNMILKPYKERLVIAGALIAAEIDRIQNS